MRFGTHKTGNYGYAPFFKAWADAVNCGENYAKNWEKWQEKWQEQWQEAKQYHTPAVNIAETEGDFTIELIVPGLQKEDFKIEVKDNQLHVWSESKAQDGEKKYRRQEYGYRNFKRSFTLPNTVDTENISAKYIDGILYVVVPKNANTKASKSVSID